MKKLAIGCGLAVLLTGAALAGFAYYVYRQVAPSIAQFAELSQVAELERQVRNRTPFVPPVSEELTDAQIEKLVKVQTDVRTRIGERVATFEQKYRELAEKQEASVQDVTTILQAYADLTRTWIEAKRAQVEALNATGLSIEEYRWIRNQAYRALGQPFVDLDVSRLVEQARSGAVSSDPVGELKGAMESLGPEANRKRIEKIRKFLEENLALASFGL